MPIKIIFKINIIINFILKINRVKQVTYESKWTVVDVVDQFHVVIHGHAPDPLHIHAVKAIKGVHLAIRQNVVPTVRMTMIITGDRNVQKNPDHIVVVVPEVYLEAVLVVEAEIVITGALDLVVVVDRKVVQFHLEVKVEVGLIRKEGVQNIPVVVDRKAVQFHLEVKVEVDQNRNPNQDPNQVIEKEMFHLNVLQ